MPEQQEPVTLEEEIRREHVGPSVIDHGAKRAEPRKKTLIVREVSNGFVTENTECGFGYDMQQQTAIHQTAEEVADYVRGYFKTA